MSLNSPDPFSLTEGGSENVTTPNVSEGGGVMGDGDIFAGFYSTCIQNTYHDNNNNVIAAAT